MEKYHNNKLLNFNQEAFEELYMADTLVQLTKSSCEAREYTGQYYGITNERRKKLSAERNNYINMLSILSDKISNIMDISLSMEKEIMLQQYSDNSSGKIATQSPANQCS